MIGGSLSPADRFPSLFGDNAFLKKYPYFLPCAVPATFSALAWLVTFFYLKETLKSPVPLSQLLKFRKEKVNSAQLNETSLEASSLDNNVREEDKPVSFRDLLIPRVILTAGNYAFLSLVNQAYRATQPLFLSTPITLGGLGPSPPTIGNIMSFFGIFSGVAQVFFFARVHDHLGSRTTFVAGLTCMFPCFIAFLILSWMAKARDMYVWIIVGLQTLLAIGPSFLY
ncbi:hypothetical protein H0H87_005385, partial [Tephrocybe sp. NHM501043]